MKFSEKLQTLRKDKKLSQEQLAEMLDVSRQSVSKWESNQSYPEMDKLLAICKIFHVTLEELTNDDISELSINAKQKNMVNSLVEQIGEFVSCTVKMITTVSPTNLAKCIVELILLFFILLFFRMPFNYIDNMFDNIIKYLPYTPYHILSSLFYFIIMIIYLALMLIICFYYFDRRWLKRFENGELNKRTISEEEPIQDSKVIIKKPSGIGKLFNVLIEIIIICFKIFVFFTAIPFACILGCLAIGIVINIYAIFNGVLYFGLLFAMIFGLALISIILEIFFNFIFNRKTNFNRIFITLIVGILGAGLGFGIFLIEAYTTNYSNEPVAVTSITEDKTYDMLDNFQVMTDNDIVYTTDESLTDKVKVSITYNKNYLNLNTYMEQGGLYITSYENVNPAINYLNLIMDDLKDRTLHDYSNIHQYTVTVITSSTNIDKIKKNKTNIEDTTVEDYYNQEISNMNIKIENYETEINTLKEQNENLQAKLDKYNETIKDLITN